MATYETTEIKMEVGITDDGHVRVFCTGLNGDLTPEDAFKLGKDLHKFVDAQGRAALSMMPGQPGASEVAT